MNQKLYLIDISSFIFRAYYAIRPLSTPDGRPVHALYGVLTMMDKLLKTEKPDYVAVCYDRPEPSFRKEIDINYKANRTEAPDDLVPQFALIREFIEELGIPSFEMVGYEADDLIGSISHWSRAHEKMQVVIVTGDKDFCQVISDQVILLDTMKDIRTNREECFKKYQVWPEQFVDYLAIIGDSSDNIPGIKGVGPKGAVTLLEKYQSLENILDHKDEITPAGLKAKVIEGEASARISQKLAQIKTDLELSLSLDILKRRPIDIPKLEVLLDSVGFKSLKKNFIAAESKSPVISTPASGSEGSVIPAHSPALLTLQSNSPFTSDLQELELKEFLNTIPYDKAISIALDPVTKYIHLVSVGKSVTMNDLSQATLLENRLLLGFDLKELARGMGLKKIRVQDDLQIARYVLAPGGDSQGFERFRAQESLNDIPFVQVVSQFERLMIEYSTKLKSENLESIYADIEKPLVSCLLNMENKGIKLDINLIREQSAAVLIDLEKVEKEILELSPEPFNVASPKQLSKILFEVLKLPVIKKTKTGASTDTDVLEALKDQHPIASKVLIYRELSKLRSTYLEALPNLVGEDGRIHSHFNQAVTATGRLSSTDPNLQNIPIKTERGNLVRKCFVPEKQFVFVSADYSQIELRILAHMSDDPGLKKAFSENIDIHSWTAREVFNTDLKSVTSEMRRQAKAVNFGLAYGQGAFGLAEVLGISRGEAKNIIETYFMKFPNVKKYMESIVVEAQKTGYVQSILGRKRYLPDLNSKSPAIRKMAERAAINAPMQGTASDLIKLAMNRVEKELPGKMVLQVHDELVLEVPLDEAEATQAQLAKIMESVMSLSVPLLVNTSVGFTWYDAH